MKLRDYIELNKIDKDDKEYDIKVLKYFNIDYSKLTPLQVKEKIKEFTNVNATKITKNKIKINGERFHIDNILKSTYSQWILLESYLTEEDYFINNLHKVLAIYIRPRVFNWKKLRWEGKKFSDIDLEKNSEKILDMDVNDAFGLNVFFYQRDKKSINNMKILYLNEKMRKLNQTMKLEK